MSRAKFKVGDTVWVRTKIINVFGAECWGKGVVPGTYAYRLGEFAEVADEHELRPLTKREARDEEA